MSNLDIRDGMMKRLDSIALPVIATGLILLIGCSSVGRVSKGAYVEAELVGAWQDTVGGKMTFMSDGSVRILDGVGQWSVDYPYIRITGPGGRTTTFTIVTFDFDAEPNTLCLSGEGFDRDQLTRVSQ